MKAKKLLHVYDDTPKGERPEKALCGAPIVPPDLAKGELGDRNIVAASAFEATKGYYSGPERVGDPVEWCKRCVQGLALLLAVLLGGCAGGAGGFSRGAYAIEYAPVRASMNDSVAKIVEVAKVDVSNLRELLKATNAKDPGAGTGALVQTILLRVALELATGGELAVKPAGGTP